MKYTVNSSLARELLPVRPQSGHKGTFGTVLVIGGSRRFPGAPALAALGAHSAGAGLVRIAFPESIYGTVTSFCRESVYLPLPEKNGMLSERAVVCLEEALNTASSVVLGCGLGVSFAVKELVQYVIKNAVCPVVLDADGINSVSGNIDILKDTAGELILTPHPGEMARLTGKSVESVNSSREELALSFAKEYGVTLLLKGHDSITAQPDGKLFVNTTGGSGLSKGGSGDLLAGIIAAFAAQGAGAAESAALGAFLHGLAGDIGEKKYTAFSLSPTLCASTLPEAFKTLSE